jgi:hypothetical protein
MVWVMGLQPTKPWMVKPLLIFGSYSTPGINVDVINAGGAEHLGVHMAASIAPHVKFSAFQA